MRMSSHRELLLCLSLLVILPVLMLAVNAIAFNLSTLLDSCQGWGAGGGAISRLPAGGCTTTASQSEMLPVILLTTVVPGGMILGSVMGVLGILRTRPWFLILSFVILALESPFLLFEGWLAVFPLIPASFFLLVTRTKILLR